MHSQHLFVHKQCHLCNKTREKFAIRGNISTFAARLTMNTYYHTSVDSFYRDLAGICPADVDIHEKYATLRETFRIAVEQKLTGNRFAFPGLFAKVDYLIKENAIPFDAGQRINTTRKILFPTSKDKAGFTDTELAASFPHDLKAVCQFISAIYKDSGIPASLRKLFPVADRVQARGKVDKRAQRAIVDSWDDNFIYAQPDNAGTRLKICYGKANKCLLGGDWQYIRDLLHKGAILNIVHIRMQGDVCCPEIIIIEPDFLVDVSTITSCMEIYADSPLVYLLNKLRPAVTTAPMLLGNLAGRFLDETIKGEMKPYPQSIREYFHKNVLIMASTDIPQTFHDEARAQKRNISKLIGEDLPAGIGEYDKDDVILEPSFLCETLGIQGRMDFLQSGGTVIIEQKSGKGAFSPYGSSTSAQDIPRPQEKHYAQLLLYRAMMQYGLNMQSNKLKNIFLLYSRYDKGLLRLGAAPGILHKAIKLRNEIAMQEISFAYDGPVVIGTLSADLLNEKKISGKLWEEYARPQIESVLHPIRNATPLERAYYLRFLRFIEMEHMLSKIGNNTKECAGSAYKWLDSLDLKKSSGNIYDNLSIRELVRNGDAVKSVKLAFGDNADAGVSNFRTGDVVILYPYAEGNVPDACAQMVFRATISDMTPSGIEVRLRNSQMSGRVFDKPASVRWAVEHDFLESSFSPLYRSMQAFLTAPQRRREFILFRREPETDASQTLIGDYKDFNTLVLRAKQARELFLVIGPPGTGKTSFCLLNIVREELAADGANVLIMSYTNRAVDEICSKLDGAGIDFIRIGSELSCAGEYKNRLLNNRATGCRNVEEVRNLIRDTRVFCGTTSSLNANMPLFAMKAFDLAVIDEASQILEPHLLGLMSAEYEGREAIKRFVLIGDHKQLPAVVLQDMDESGVTEPELRAIGLTDCRRSFFERMLERYRDDSRFVYMLTRQGRMHRDIAMFPNKYFYHGCLDVVPCPHQDTELQTCPDSGNGIIGMLATRRMVFLAVSPTPSPLSGKVNRTEADMIAATVVQAYRMRRDTFDVEKSIGVIVPYRNQIATIRNAIGRYRIGLLHGITIDTVERFQGSQRDIIIYGFTIQKPCQLNFLVSNVFEDDGDTVDRKLNVVMTRAREHLIMIGNPRILSKASVFSDLIKYARHNQFYFEIEPDKYCAGDFHIPERSCRKTE